jgi:hypothetical protein
LPPNQVTVRREFDDTCAKMSACAELWRNHKSLESWCRHQLIVSQRAQRSARGGNSFSLEAF